MQEWTLTDYYSYTVQANDHKCSESKLICFCSISTQQTSVCRNCMFGCVHNDADYRRREISSAPPAKRPCLSSVLSLSQLPPSITSFTQQPAVDSSSTPPPPLSICQPLPAVGSSSTQQAPANSPSVSLQLMSDQPNKGVQLSVNPDLLNLVVAAPHLLK